MTCSVAQRPSGLCFSSFLSGQVHTGYVCAHQGDTGSLHTSQSLCLQCPYHFQAWLIPPSHARVGRGSPTPQSIPSPSWSVNQKTLVGLYKLGISSHHGRSEPCFSNCAFQSLPGPRKPSQHSHKCGQGTSFLFLFCFSFIGRFPLHKRFQGLNTEKKRKEKEGKLGKITALGRCSHAVLCHSP